ncbi:NAD(P)H-quinone oxidoreductase [Devosia chinhatensis]|uniref:Enoyl reductase (ER) domain-containing protein n=1 Tax=Devosia chinhatensis TaxID=429727 RepID=A0A0F5FGZ3_9HYPH|nr:NAD(P)H-quinone oxidoreductase [Devosia chinhatensis]KKB07482.1 hypothetical protein VE26_12050 [Devosia chinhatensis]
MTLPQSLPPDMLAIAIDAPGGPDMLVPHRMALPNYGANDVLIRVAAAGVNGPDLAQRRGLYDPPPGASPLPGLEVAGEIAALGGDVADLKPGQKVMALTNGGGYAEYAAVPAGQVLPVPVGWSLVEAAALPETWFTITQTLVMRAGLRKGMFVLVHGASGGIGGAAIQIAGILGARAIAVVSDTAKGAYCLSLGAEAIIDRTREQIVDRVMSITDGHGADRIVDLIGGDIARLNVEAAARNGHIVQVSTLGGGTAELPLRQMMAKGLTLSGSTLRPQDAQTKAAIARHMQDNLLPALAARDWPRPAITTFSLEDAAKAHALMEGRSHYGKLILTTAFGAGDKPT